MRQSVLLFAIGAIAVCVSACSTGTSCPAGTAADGAGECQAPCAGPSDCGACEACASGFCAEVECVGATCSDPADCPRDAPICGADSACRACVDDPECTALLGEAAVCEASGGCYSGDCTGEGSACGLPLDGVCRDHLCSDCVDTPECVSAYGEGSECVGGACVGGAPSGECSALGVGCCDNTGHFQPENTPCGLCKACNATGSCELTPATDSICGEGSVCDPNTCSAFGTCTPDAPDTTKCGLCAVCNGAGACDGVPASDSACSGDCQSGACSSLGVCSIYPVGTECGTTDVTVKTNCVKDPVEGFVCECDFQSCTLTCNAAGGCGGCRDGC